MLLLCGGDAVLNLLKDNTIFYKIVSFGFFGILTTVFNVALYYGFRFIRIPVAVSTILAWFLCVLFAFITSKKCVFKSDNYSKKDYIKEIVLFYSSRAFSGAMDVVIMILLVNILKWNEVFAKILDEVLVSAFNFVFSFLVIFRTKKSIGEKNNG